ncbi:hypothetical protein PsorP6_000711 [Peronosclerospora sorghi]|uniref:Uncharacterized protein n=1 Tax=Peronosclerospora sorghi TaxID=230839 RepID=A0ACC0WPU5_9STRA|nr:hypothetical protein PsorP6_000711 [Peronosclerospora sorghi]
MKSQAMQFTCVAWDRQSGSPDESQSILIGTDSGAVFEAEFEYVMLTTSASGKRPTRMFQFIGWGVNGLETMFNEYVKPEKLRFQELPGEITMAELRFYAKQERERAKASVYSQVKEYTMENLYLDSPQRWRT